MHEPEVDKYRLVDVAAAEVEAWNRLVEESEQGTFFSRYEYLQNTGLRFDCKLVYKGNSLAAGISVIESTNGEDCVLDDLVVYNGILFGKPDHKQKYYGILYDQHEVTLFIIKYLVRKYRHLEMSLGPSFRDLRPFLWHEYGNPNPSAKFCLDIRYTSFIDINELAPGVDEESTALFMDLERLRKKNIRRARKVGAIVEESDDVSGLMQMYRGMMARQNVEVPGEKLERIENAIRAMLQSGYARMFLSRDADSNEGTIQVFGLDNKRAYSWYMASDAQSRSNYSGTMVYWDAFKALRARGFNEVDLEGVNSPDRGRFKLSFGGLLLPYHEVYWG